MDYHLSDFGLNTITNETSTKDILRYRGFILKSDESIEDYFNSYSYPWCINSIRKEDIISVDDAAKLYTFLFSKDSMDYRFSCTDSNGKFRDFCDDHREIEVGPAELDPFVARYTLAINKIGVHSIMSCDGWHKNLTNGRVVQVWMHDRYSVIWLWIINELCFGYDFDIKRAYNINYWTDKWQPDNSPDDTIDSPNKLMITILPGNERIVYSRINKEAEFIEFHSEQLSKIKEIMIHKIFDNNISENIEKMSFLKAHNQLKELIATEIKSIM